VTNKQRREVKRDFGVTIPSDIPVRCKIDEDVCALQVFIIPGQNPWIPFGAKYSEPGEVDNHNRATTVYYFDRLKSRKERKDEKDS